MKLAFVALLACFGMAAAIHTVEQAQEINAILAALAQAPETNYGCSVEENMDEFYKLVDEESAGFTTGCTRDAYDRLMENVNNAEYDPADGGVFTIPIRFALKNPTHDESSTVSASSYVFGYGPVPARFAKGFLMHAPSTSTSPAFDWVGNEHEDHTCASLIIRTLYDLDHGHIDWFSGCEGRDPVNSITAADLSVKGHPKWLANCGGLADHPETECLKTLLFAKNQDEIDEMYGFRDIGHGMKSRNRACFCTATQTNNFAPPIPVPATCDTMAVPEGWLRCDDPAADCNCPIGWDDPECQSTGYGNGVSCRCTCYDRHRDCIEGVPDPETGERAGPNSEDINCLDTVCTMNDIDTCMIMIPVWCDSAECPPGWRIKKDAADIQCAGVSIADGGMGHIECEMSIGVGEVNMFAKHGATDTSTCCDELAKCKNGVTGDLFNEGGLRYRAAFTKQEGKDKGITVKKAGCRAHNYNGDVYEPLPPVVDTTGDGEPDSIYCGGINQTACTTDLCCSHMQCKPVEHCVGLLGCMAPEQESSCSKCDVGYFGGACIACPVPDNMIPGSKTSCTKLKDITVIKGHCIEGYHLVVGGSRGPDRCDECPHIEGCMLGFVSCSSPTNGICAKCKGGWTGDQCQHEPVFEDVDMTVCSGHGKTLDPFRPGLSTCVGGGCEGEKYMVQGVQVGPQERWVQGECTWYPAGKMNGLQALIKMGKSDDVTGTEKDDFVQGNANYAGPANDHIDRDGNAFQKRRRLAAATMAEAAAKSLLQARQTVAQLATTTPAPVISDEVIAENAKALEAADEAIKAEDANEHELARESQAADAARAELVKEQALAAETQAEDMARAAEQLHLEMLKAEADKPREGTCACGGANDVWEALPGIGEFEDQVCLTFFQGEMTPMLCSDPDVECGSCEGTCRVLPPTEPCECDDGYTGDDCEVSASCAAITDEDLTFPAAVSDSCPDGAQVGSFCELTCAEEYYMVSKSDGFCTADAGTNTASYKGHNVNCRLCTPIHHCLGHEAERRLATGFTPHARRLSGEKGKITCSTAEDSVCDQCAPGYYGKTCEPCPLGKYMGDGSLKCSDCEKGQYTSLEGSTACGGCQPGEYVEVVQCVKCDPGTYSAEVNSASCTDCDAMTVTSEMGLTECTACEAGTYQKNAGRSKCHDCTPMEHCVGDLTCTNNRNQQCAECAAGFHASKDGKSCKQCVTAEHCLEGGTICTAAGDGEMGADRDRSMCTQGFCLPGFHVDIDGICLRCPILPNCMQDMETCHAVDDGGDGSIANGQLPLSTCLECKPGWQGDTCEESALDAECFDQGFKYGDDGSGCKPGAEGGVDCEGDAPLNDGTTHPEKEHTYFGCQLECRKDKACELFSYNTEDHTCMLHSLDAGCVDEGCPEQALTFVNERGDNGNLQPAPGWIAGPKMCNLATCDEMVCPEGWYLDMEFIFQNKAGKTRSAIKCQREECTLEHDLERCCVPSVCGEYTCDEDRIAKPGVEALMCSDREGAMRDEIVMSESGDDALGQFHPACTGDDDRDMCCDLKAKCITMECPTGFTHKRDGLHVSKKNCAGAVCTEEADLETCCDGLATCETFKCPVHSKAVDVHTGEVRNIDFLPRPDPHTIFCNGMECDDSWDRDTCCAQRAECHSMECPEGYVHSEWSIRTQIACEGIACTVEADLNRCCFPIVYCDTMIANGAGEVCPEGYSPKFDLTNIACDSGSGRCDVRIDRDTCCDKQEECEEMSPTLYDCHLINNDFGPDCDGRCVREKCLAKASYGCAWALGPPEMPWNAYTPEGTEMWPSLDEEDEPVGTGACGWAECHREWHDCVCPHGEDEWGDDEQMEGAFFPSGFHEFVITGMGWHGPIDKFDGDCNPEGNLVNGGGAYPDGKGAQLVTPKLSGDGNSEKCSEGYTNKIDPKDTYCHGPWCTLEADFKTCCVKQASCDTLMSTLEGYSLKAQPYEILCAGEICDPVVDRDTCCDAQGACADMACPAGSQQKVPAEGEKPFLCAMGACDPLVDAEACCDECAPGTYSTTSGNDCVDCEQGKYSENGYSGTGSLGCLDCRSGKYADPGMDHCLDCSPIFACSSKAGMFLDAQPTEPPQADFMMMHFNTAGCADTGGEITTEQQCQAACEYLGMDYATDGTNVVETGPATCFSQQGNFCKFALGTDPSTAMDTLAPLCVGGGDADGAVGHGIVNDEIMAGFRGEAGGVALGEGSEILDTHDAERAAAMVADVERRRLTASFVAVMQMAGSDNVQCSGEGDAICTACHIGYYGSGTNTCTKCEKMENCEYGCGHEYGVSCDTPSGAKKQEECGDCKEGFFEPYCTGCTVIEGCVEDKMTCTTAADTKCAKCAPGYFPADPIGEMDVCAACVTIPHCTKAFCTNSEDHICLECAFGYFPAGAVCAPVVFEEDLSIFTYEYGPNHDVVEVSDADFGPPVCTRTVAKGIDEAWTAAKNAAEAEDLPHLASEYADMCSDAGCDADAAVIAGMTMMNGCYAPAGDVQPVGLLKML
jgi:hypothetical protein